MVEWNRQEVTRRTTIAAILNEVHTERSAIGCPNCAITTHTNAIDCAKRRIAIIFDRDGIRSDTTNNALDCRSKINCKMQNEMQHIRLINNKLSRYKQLLKHFLIYSLRKMIKNIAQVDFITEKTLTVIKIYSTNMTLFTLKWCSFLNNRVKNLINFLLWIVPIVDDSQVIIFAAPKWRK